MVHTPILWSPYKAFDVVNRRFRGPDQFKLKLFKLLVVDSSISDSALQYLLYSSLVAAV